ncbi:MAG: hypothetical protein P1U56_22810 [Saprospiraceae bacterium]|nr:hypothetical protein [Saprospiraceae bacterium]
MKFTKIVFAFASFLFIFSSCSPTLRPFTDNIYDEFGESKEMLSKVQFYLSSDIVLYRDFGESQSRVVDGKIRIVDGRKIEEVVFRKGTPGVFVFSPKRDRIAISFEQNDDNYLMFGPNQKVGGRFVLLAKEWKRKRGKVTYANKTWLTTDDSAYANLMVDLEKARKNRISKKTVSGRRI